MTQCCECGYIKVEVLRNLMIMEMDNLLTWKRNHALQTNCNRRARRKSIGQVFTIYKRFPVNYQHSHNFYPEVF